MSKKFLFISALCFASVISFAQTNSAGNPGARQQEKQKRRDHINKLIKQSEEGALIYQKQNLFGVKANTDGLSFLYEHGKYKSINKTNVWFLELGEHHSAKEDKQTLTDGLGFAVGNSFKFGKINNFYFFKAGIGQQLLIGGKNNQNGVAVSLIYGGGLDLGLIKPYYLQISDSVGDITDIKYSAATQSEFLDPYSIIGASGFGKGFNEITVVPGVQAKTALRFDYGRFNQLLSAVEVGVNAEYYTKNMQIMFSGPAKKFFFTGYVAIEFGSRK